MAVIPGATFAGEGDPFFVPRDEQLFPRTGEVVLLSGTVLNPNKNYLCAQNAHTTAQKTTLTLSQFTVTYIDGENPPKIINDTVQISFTAGQGATAGSIFATITLSDGASVSVRMPTDFEPAVDTPPNALIKNNIRYAMTAQSEYDEVSKAYIQRVYPYVFVAPNDVKRVNTQLLVPAGNTALDNFINLNTFLPAADALELPSPRPTAPRLLSHFVRRRFYRSTGKPTPPPLASAGPPW